MDTSVNSLDSSGISLIIESCAKHGVAVIKFGDLYVRFGSKADPSPGSSAAGETTSALPIPTPATEIAEQQEKETERSIEEQTVQLREAQLAQALVEDPVMYEQMVRDGELEDADGDSGDDGSGD